MTDSAPQTDNRVDLTPLLNKARLGDSRAFDALMQALSPPILNALRRQGANSDDAEDALSCAMLIMHRQLKQCRFDDMQTGGFIAYFRRVAIHEWLHRPEVRRGLEVTRMTVLDADTGEAVDLDIPDDSLPLQDRVANRSLYDFLLQQMDEVFVASRQGAERCRGELEKLAFLYFYQDGMTQNEIYTILSLLGANFPLMAPITRADLNNWLSMGRSLKALLKHLADHHGEMVGMLAELHLSGLDLAPETAAILRAHYCDGNDPETIARDRGWEIVRVQQALAQGRRTLVDALARTIKSQLKVSRSG